jgi:membrane protease YdiL (CAAX protease family)
MNISKPKYAIIKAVALAIIPILFLSVAGAAIVITKSEANESKSLVIQTIAVAAAIVIGLVIAKFSVYGYREIGLAKADGGSGKKALYYLPIITVEVIALLTGFNEANTISRILLLLIFTASVGICEELFYRGLVFRYLTTYGVQKAILLSSVIFGIGHLAGLMSGQLELKYVLLQTLFAFVFGFAAACVAYLAKSLLPVILWHFSHDFIAYVTKDDVIGVAFVILIIQLIILAGYSIFLWKKIAAQEKTSLT